MEIALGTLIPKMSIRISRCRRFWKRITYTQKRIGIYTGLYR